MNWVLFTVDESDYKEMSEGRCWLRGDHETEDDMFAVGTVIFCRVASTVMPNPVPLVYKIKQAKWYESEEVAIYSLEHAFVDFNGNVI